MAKRTGFTKHRPAYDVITTEEHLLDSLKEMLQQQVAAMNVNNFVVRPKRKFVETYSKPEAWKNLKPENIIEAGTGDIRVAHRIS